MIDRHAEKQALHEVLDSVRAGMSGALILRGEPGVGKSALLDYAVERAEDLQIVRTLVEAELLGSIDMGNRDDSWGTSVRIIVPLRGRS